MNRAPTVYLMNRDEYEKTYRTEESFWWFVAKRRLVERWAARCLSFGRGRILDLGCGTGANLEALARQSEAYGLDSESAALECASRRQLAGLCAAQAGRVPFAAGSFGLVTALDLLEHLQDDQGVLAEAWRVLQPGGWFLVTVPAYPWLWGAHDLALGHRRRYRREELRAKLAGAGFRLVRVVHFFGLFFPFMLPVRIGQKRWGSPEETISYEPWSPLNRLLLRVAEAEVRLLDRFALPFGTTLVGLAQKPGGVIG
jgi:SAM-dependent methyltransferase